MRLISPCKETNGMCVKVFTCSHAASEIGQMLLEEIKKSPFGCVL